MEVCNSDLSNRDENGGREREEIQIVTLIVCFLKFLVATFQFANLMLTRV